jgi:hypothetical protein
MVVNGDLSLGSGAPDGWCSGGFIANSVVTKSIKPNGQQQWCSRNTEVREGWNGSPSIFNSQVGNTGKVGTGHGIVQEAPIVAEKPFLVYEKEKDQVVIHIPRKRLDERGPDHSTLPEETLVVTEEMLITTDAKSADAINAKLKNQSEQNGWKALVVLPGE